MNNLNPNQPDPKSKGVRRWLRRPPLRKVLPEETAGGIIYRRTSKGVEFLLIQYPKREDPKGRWTIPKGHVEAGERSHETALREITEETGLRNLRLLDWLGKMKFQYRRGEALVMMTLNVFLVEAPGDSKSPRPQHGEGIKDVRWFSVNEALDLIEYEETHKLMLLALKKIRNGS